MAFIKNKKNRDKNFQKRLQIKEIDLLMSLTHYLVYKKTKN